MNKFYNKTSKGSIAISRSGLKTFAENLGYAKHYFKEDRTSTPVYIYKSGKVIEPVIPIRIHEAIISELEFGATFNETMPPEDLRIVVDKLMESNIISSPELLITLAELDKPIITDTRDSAIFPFRNGLVTVTRDEIQFSPLESIDGYIWTSQITDRDFEVVPSEEYMKSDFYLFIRHITSLNPAQGWREDDDRFRNLYSLIGYLLHSFRSPVNRRAVVFMDASLDDEPAGQTGKNLLVTAIGQLRKTTSINGKDYDGMYKYKFASIEPDTKLLYIDDVGKNFDFESLFNVITEGPTVEEKYSRAFKIPYEKSPKIIISTNYALKGRGSSHEARRYEFALSNYYSNRYTPADSFGRWFFDEWDHFQWLYFYNLMLNAVQYYLKNGVTTVTDSNIWQKKFITETSMEFVEWISEQNFTPNIKYSTTKIYDQYESYTGSKVDPKILIGYLRAYAARNNCNLAQPHSGGNRYLEFKPR